MRIKHGTKIRMELLDKANLERVVYLAVVDAELVDGHMTVTSIKFNALTMSGGIRWRHPITGEHFPRGLTWNMVLVDPTDELKNGALCDCADCQQEAS